MMLFGQAVGVDGAERGGDKGIVFSSFLVGEGRDVERGLGAKLSVR